MAENTCAAARLAIETRDFVGWRGLPEGCDPHAVFADLPALTDLPEKRLGEDYQSASFALLALPGYYRPQASFRAGELMLFDGANPDLHGGYERLRADLGTPTATYDWDYGLLHITDGEWVYPERGLTLFVNTDATRALHIALYHPASLTDYRARLRLHLGTTKKPLRRA